MKRIYLAASLSLLTFAAYADTAATPATKSSLAGTYQCKRSDANNTTLTITKNTQAYTFEWDNDSGNPVMLGSGDMHPSLPNVISVAFSDPKNANAFGVELFSVKPDGSLDASWALQSSNTSGTETCTKK
jgi:hypothetical protein